MVTDKDEIKTKKLVYTQAALHYHLLAHPIRIAILDLLSSKERSSWTEIQEKLHQIFGEDASNPNVINFHLTKLVQEEIIEKDEEGKYHIKQSSPPFSQLNQTLSYLARKLELEAKTHEL